jgi:hypothetical protein
MRMRPVLRQRAMARMWGTPRALHEKDASSTPRPRHDEEAWSTPRARHEQDALNTPRARHDEDALSTPRACSDVEERRFSAALRANLLRALAPELRGRRH